LINLFEAVDGSNNSYGLAAGCPGLAPVETNADTLIVRHAAQDIPAALTAGAVYLQSVRGGIFPPRIFIGTTVPAGPGAATSQVNPLVVNAYYVSRASTFNATVPSLQVYRLQQNGPFVGRMTNEEVVLGVEDLQIQFGVDTDLPDTVDRGSIDRYVNANDPMIDPTNAAFNSDVVILAVRVWVRVRAERPEVGFVDTATYTYADQNVGPFNDNFRRIVASKTIYLRNARPYS
jgi:type IV pilus assembly protein PilW